MVKKSIKWRWKSKKVKIKATNGLSASEKRALKASSDFAISTPLRTLYSIKLGYLAKVPKIETI